MVFLPLGASRNIRSFPWITCFLFLLALMAISYFELPDPFSFAMVSLLMLTNGLFIRIVEETKDYISIFATLVLTIVSSFCFYKFLNFTSPVFYTISAASLGLFGLLHFYFQKNLIRIKLYPFAPITFPDVFVKSTTIALAILFLDITIMFVLPSAESFFIYKESDSQNTLTLILIFGAHVVVRAGCFFLGFLIGRIRNSLEDNSEGLFLRDESKILNQLSQEENLGEFLTLAKEVREMNWQNFEITQKVLKRLEDGDREDILSMNKPIRDWMASDTMLLIKTENHSALAKSIQLYAKVYDLWMGSLFRDINPNATLVFAEYCLSEGFNDVAFSTFSYLRNLAPPNIDLRKVGQGLRQSQESLGIGEPLKKEEHS